MIVDNCSMTCCCSLSVVDIGNLPTAPRGALDIDYSTVPNTGPFVAHVANLSFEIDDESLRRIFADLNVNILHRRECVDVVVFLLHLSSRVLLILKTKSARVMRDGMRSRGVGLVEFETREHLIEALKKTDKEVYGRKIRVNVSDKTDSHQNDGNRGGFGSRTHRSGAGGGEERPEMADKWRRAERNELFDERTRTNRFVFFFFFFFFRFQLKLVPMISSMTGQVADRIVIDRTVMTTDDVSDHRKTQQYIRK
jgi:RNA recognition motif-containing protein